MSKKTIQRSVNSLLFKETERIISLVLFVRHKGDVEKSSLFQGHIHQLSELAQSAALRDLFMPELQTEKKEKKNLQN